jgi:hypothetical protein
VVLIERTLASTPSVDGAGDVTARVRLPTWSGSTWFVADMVVVGRGSLAGFHGREHIGRMDGTRRDQDFYRSFTAQCC